MKYAIVIANEIREIFDEEPNLHPDIVVMEVPADAQVGWVLTDGKFAPPVRPEIDLREIVDRAVEDRINGAYGTAQKRMSAYGYFAHLNALKAAGSITDERQNDLVVLMAAAEWEESMISKSGTVTTVDQVAEEAFWPAPPIGLAALAAAC